MLKMNEQTVDAYRQKVRAQIKEMKAKMQMIEAGSQKASADMRIKYQKNLKDWRARLDELDKKLDKLSDSSQKAWEDLRSGIDKTMSELRSSIEGSTEQFNK